MASITLSHLLKTYGASVQRYGASVQRYDASAKGNTVIQDLSADIHEGEFVVIVGPSGCGMSTQLPMVAGLDEVPLGTVSIVVRVVNDLALAEHDIAMVFQNYAPYPRVCLTTWPTA